MTDQSIHQHMQQDELISRVGHMTRLLHDSLRGLGLDKLLERAAEDIPDARDRLDYVAKMSEQAAQRVLNATDIAIPLQEKLDSEAKRIRESVALISQGAVTIEQYKQAMNDISSYLTMVSSHSMETKSHLMDIMMAQDFQDLTGQVIKKVTSLAQNLEQQLVQLLIDYSPNDLKKDVVDGLLNGPQINPEGKTDVVANQSQVDDLLDSLGF
ncbi:protein phosphatase CheZ [Undibacterium griseum]|uniref:Protein phosphatase CheZ n=1 Tax=Undibacterium griseum TaxID=2762295 RepID=A0ABR6YRW4_9BURK|nr:protein phosphatase CheZ [Undibacterium griseum]MBC3886652.1 protein phosphatase CheZ [Undibacterium griseum]